MAAVNWPHADLVGARTLAKRTLNRRVDNKLYEVTLEERFYKSNKEKAKINSKYVLSYVDPETGKVDYKNYTPKEKGLNGIIEKILTTFNAKA